MSFFPLGPARGNPTRYRKRYDRATTPIQWYCFRYILKLLCERIWPFLVIQSTHCIYNILVLGRIPKQRALSFLTRCSDEFTAFSTDRVRNNNYDDSFLSTSSLLATFRGHGREKRAIKSISRPPRKRTWANPVNKLITHAADTIFTLATLSLAFNFTRRI